MKGFLLIILLGLVPVIFAQSDVFETDGKGSRDIERGHRIASAPKIIDTIRTSAVPNRPLLQAQQNVSIKSDTIAAATIETEQLLEKYYPFYLKAGMGSTLMPLGELYVNSTRSRSNYYGFHVQHLLPRQHLLLQQMHHQEMLIVQVVENYLFLLLPVLVVDNLLIMLFIQLLADFQAQELHHLLH